MIFLNYEYVYLVLVIDFQCSRVTLNGKLCIERKMDKG